MVKRMISLVLSLVLLAGMTAVVPTVGAAETQSEQTGASGTTGSCTWSLSGTVLTISGNGRMKDYNVSYNSKPPWGTNITQVIVNYGVTYIGEDAFYGCENLTEVHLADGTLTEIGESAFAMCKNLEEIVIPDSVETIQSYVFGYCFALKEVTLSKNLSFLGFDAFLRCHALEHIELPDSITSLAGEVFYMCTALKSVRLPAHLDSICSGAFQSCAALESLVLPDTLTIIQSTAFRGCTKLAAINIPSGVTDFGASIFEGTAWLKNQPEGGLYINNCLLDYVGECPEVLTVRDGTVKIYGVMNQPTLQKVVIPHSVTAILNSAFSGCTALTDFVIPDSVTRIGSSVLSGCTALKSVYIPDSVTSLGSSAFNNCTALEDIRLSENIPVISAYYGEDGVGGYSFNNCTALKSLVLPKGLRRVAGAFRGCSSLEKVLALNPDFTYTDAFIRTTNPYTYAPVYKLSPSGDCRVELDGGVLTVSGSGAMADYSDENPTPLSQFPEIADTVTSVVIGEGVTAIGDRAFAGFANLSSVQIPSTLTRIGDSAFEDCVSLDTLPDLSGVTCLGSRSLENTAWLNRQPDGIVTVDGILYQYKDCPRFVRVDARVVAAGAFGGSETLEEVEIHEGVAYINAGAFADCPALVAAGFFSDACAIGDGAFLNSPQLVFYCSHNSTAHLYAKENNIPFRKVSGQIGDLRWVMEGTKLTVYGSGNIPSGNGPWHDDVTEIVLGKGVGSVGNSAFGNLSKLDKLVVQSRTTSFDAWTLPAGRKVGVYCYKGSEADKRLKPNVVHPITVTYLGEKGDANIDGAVNIGDATFLQMLLAEYGDRLLTADDPDVLAQGDMNDDGRLTVSDVTAIQRYLAEAATVG